MPFKVSLHIFFQILYKVTILTIKFHSILEFCYLVNISSGLMVVAGWGV